MSRNDESRPDTLSHIRPIGLLPLPNGYPGATPGVPADFSGSQQELADILPFFRKRKRIILAVALAVFMCGALYCFFAKRLYEATAVLEIRGYAPLLAGSSGESMYGLDTRRDDFQRTTTAKLRRRATADLALAREGLARDVHDYLVSQSGFSLTGWILSWFTPSSDATAKPELLNDDPSHYLHRQELIRSYRGLIDVSPIHETSLVEVTATTADPQLSKRIANVHSESFVNQIRQERQDTVLANMQILRVQSDDLKQRLQKAEEALGRYAEEHKLVVSSTSDGSDLSIRKIGTLNELLSAATARRVASESIYRQVEGADPSEASAVDDETVGVLRASLHQAQADAAQLAEKVTGEFPALKELKARVATLKRSIQEERKRLINNARARFEADKNSEERLREQIQSEKAQTNDDSKLLVHYNLLKREAESLRDLYQTVLKQIEEAQISASSGGNTVFISEHAQVPTEPAVPKVNLILVLSALVGAACGIVVAIALEFFDGTFTTPEETAAGMQLPLLGFIPAFKNDKHFPAYGQAAPKRPRSVAWQRMALPDENAIDKERPLQPSSKAGKPASKSASPTSGVSTNGSSSHREDVQLSPLVTVSAPNAIVSEMLRTIKAGILLSTVDAPPKSILITSSQQQEGKTTITANLAVTLAKAGHRTLVIDADFRSASLGRLLGMPPEKRGIVDVLVGQISLAEALHTSKIENLTVLPAGSRPPNPSELVSSKRLADLIKQFQEYYDFVLVDSPPVLPVSDALHLSRATEAVVIVVRSNLTEKASAKEVRRRLMLVGARILGVVVNDFDMSRFGSASSQTRPYCTPYDDSHFASAV
ncbi:MAG: polysaccharide biosynthesis tyrosine autokinase [Deltaproteobacteria bacterium]|nr:polysaccharide biosynthesis tyrosine autokinase [Deltaproteobacteria bacterium]